jgi:hypothetical protein
MQMRRAGRLPILLIAAMLSAATLYAQRKIAPPIFGQCTAGDDYFLANYTQLQDYWRKLSRESDRIRTAEIGKTAEGRPQLMLIITSPANHQRLSRYKEISQELALAEGLTNDQARALAAEGKAVVWIDAGLHATECVNAQGLFRMAYEMATRNDPETLRILDNVILLLVAANPDGMELVSNWYMREAEPAKRNMSLPRLYHKYVGHDNNRDSYMNSQPETENISRQMFIEWMPQIMYNQHQSGPAGTILFMAPFRDPFNYNQDPLVLMGIDLVGAAIHNRFIEEGKPGAVMRDAGSFSTWFNGGVRTTANFHNIIGLLSEIQGNPTPIEIPLIPSRLLPSGGQPLPVAPGQIWHMAQSIDYLISANRAILDVAAKMKEDFLFRIYRMGRNSIEKGSRDNWMMTPKRLAALEASIANDRGERQTAGDVAGTEAYYGFRTPIPVQYYDAVMKDPALRDARAYIIPADQPDFPTAVKFVNALIKSGVVIHRATSSFQAAGKTYPAGSYVVQCAQAYRPHVLDMFEPQDHPNDFQYPGGPPKPPYDVTGYTLAYQMGIQFDRVLDRLEGPFERLPFGQLVKMPTGRVNQGTDAAGYLLHHRVNDAFVATTRLLAANEEVFWLKNKFAANGETYPPGTVYIPSKSATLATLQKLSTELGLSFDATAAAPAGDAFRLRMPRVGLWDMYGGSMSSGWMRWLLEQAFPFPVKVVYPPELDEGNLSAKFDVLIFPDGAIPARDRGRGGPAAAAVPDEFKTRVGRVTIATTIPQLRRFVEEGGTILAIGGSTSIAHHFGLPLANPLVERLPDGTEKPLPQDKFYVPGSVLQAAIDNSNPIAYGMADKADVFFNSSDVFRLEPDASLKGKGVHPVAWFPTATPLRSGWAWGQHYLQGTVAVAEAEVGKGRVILYGPEVAFRGQSHGTFKLLFNGIYLAGATAVRMQQPSLTN